MRAKSMTLHPMANKYIRNIRHIRIIQARLHALQFAWHAALSEHPWSRSAEPLTIIKGKGHDWV